MAQKSLEPQGEQGNIQSVNQSIDGSIDQLINFALDVIFREPMSKRGMRVTLYIRPRGPCECLKTRRNDRNFSTQLIATLLRTTCCERLATLL